MNRNVASLLFVGGTLLLMLAPKTEGQALAEPSREEEKTDWVAPRAPASPPSVAEDAAKTMLANAGVKPVATPDASQRGSCVEGMVEVEGDYCPALEQRCTRWMDPETTIPRRCAEFAPTGACQGKTVKKHFCIDRFEYPNKLGDKPIVMKTFFDAETACKAQGKRMCGDTEWTLACEGQERLPYPYGYQRNSEACNIDKPHPDVNERALGSPDQKVRDAEVARLWQGEPSGSRDSCVSPFGAVDMTGNVDEWVVNESGQPYKSGLKGGYWGPVRDRCRPMTTAHGPEFQFYQVGFRCCAEVPSSGHDGAKKNAGAPAGGRDQRGDGVKPPAPAAARGHDGPIAGS